MMALRMLDCYLMGSVLASRELHSPNLHFAAKMEAAEECDSGQSLAVCGVVCHFPHSPGRPLCPPIPWDQDLLGPALAPFLPGPAFSFGHK